MPVVIGNEALLTQCFSSLLDNAVKFARPATPPQVRIWSEPLAGTTAQEPSTIGTSPVDPANEKDSPRVQFVRIWIEDNGTGIPTEAQSRIFEMFQRLTDDQRGTGIGLAIVRKVVEQMRGRIGVESEIEKGSRFWVNLERAASGASALQVNAVTCEDRNN